MTQKKFFVRVPENIYDRVKEVSEKQHRPVQSQTEILIIAALNRNLVHPEELIEDKKKQGKLPI